MIRCVRIWTGEDGDSLFEPGYIPLPQESRGDLLSEITNVTSISFRETQAGGGLTWHVAPTRQFVLTLSGTLEFSTRSGATFTIAPGDVLLAEDTTGSGHSWKLIDNAPWKRAYIVFAPGMTPSFSKRL